MRTPTWGEFTRGMRVYVRRAGTPTRGVTWTFLCHAYNSRTGSSWLELFGGQTHHQTMRAFKPAEVRTRK